jgi:4-amino-4-deoxy-L-arabinose transferase-like glycosyltransferase
MATAAFAVLPGLGVGTLWDNSETAYGEVAREILLTGDSIVMHLNGAPWFVQPPLYFWVAALCIKLFGFGTLALRLPAAAATIVMGGALGLFTERVAGLRAALFVSVIAATALMQTVIGRLAIMDALLDCAVTVALLGAFRALHWGDKRAWHVTWVASALGVLAKGPVAPVVTLLVIGVWLLWERRCGAAVAFPDRWTWVSGGALFLVLVVPWFALLAHAVGFSAWSELIGHYTIGRYTGTIENQQGPIWYYVPVLILGFFPWIAFLAPACAFACNNARTPEGSLERFLLTWAIVPFAFFSFAQTKLPNYIALEIPALSLLTALWFHAVIDRRSRSIGAWAWFLPLSVGLMWVAVAVFSHKNRLDAGLQSVLGDLVWIGAVLLVGFVACFCFSYFRRTAAFSPLATGAAVLCAMLIIALVAEPHAERFKPIPTLAQTIQRERRPGDSVAIWGVAGSNALVFYTQPRVIEFTPEREEEQVRAAICSSMRLFFVTSRKRSATLPAYGRRRRELLTLGRDVLSLYDGPPCSAP